MVGLAKLASIVFVLLMLMTYNASKGQLITSEYLLVCIRSRIGPVDTQGRIVLERKAHTCMKILLPLMVQM